jgi:cytochrome P450
MIDIGEIALNPFLLTVLFLSVLGGFFCGLVFFHFFDSRVFDERGRLIPSPVHHLWGNNYFPIARLAYFTQQYSRTIFEKFLKGIGNGDIVGYSWINGSNTIIVAHPDMVRNVLSGHYLKFLKDDSWENVKEILGSGLATCNEKVWQRHRNILSPLFRSSNLRDVVTTFNIHSRRLLRHWHFRLQNALKDTNRGNSPIENNKDKPPFVSIKSLIDVEFRHLIMGIMCEAAIGYDFFTKSKSDLFATDFEIVLNEYSNRLSDPLFKMKKKVFREDQKQFLRSLHSVHSMIEKNIMERMNGIYSNNYNSFIGSTDGMPPSVSKSSSLESPNEFTNDLLQLLLAANEDTVDYQKLSIAEIRDHILSFMILGYDNTASTLMWIIYEFCLNQDIQLRCQQEVDAILTVKGVKTSAVTYEDIPRFSRLIEALKETLRLHPPMATLTRRCTTSCNIGDYQIKSGTKISISILALHQREDYWYLPTQFFPDRFSAENVAETIKHPFQYLPFGAGSRNCIGQRFAQMAVVVILAILLSKYHFEVDESDLKKIQFEEKVSNSIKNFKVSIYDREDLEKIAQEKHVKEQR